jgi:N-sulfoglucosamine sulfohydrolase
MPSALYFRRSVTVLAGVKPRLADPMHGIFRPLVQLVSCLIVTLTCHAAQQPNLVVFIADDYSYFDTSITGSGDIQTPNFARIARKGMMFTRAFAPSPSCAPSRAAFLTGLPPIRNGAMFNHQAPQKEIKKLPAYLKELGYEVVAFGKVAHYRQAKEYGFDLVEYDTFHDDVCVKAAIEWLDKRQSDKPLCLMVGTNWPHVPWPKRAPDIDPAHLKLPPTHVDTPRTRQAKARYNTAVRRMDNDLGAVYDAAYKKLGDNTLFIQFSDHGTQWPFGKWNLYDAGLHVPFFAIWPGVIQPDGKCDQLTTLLDLLPTLIDAGGGKVPPDLSGHSLLPAMRGESNDAPSQVFATHSGDGKMNEYPMRSVRTERWKYIRNLSLETTFTSHIDKGGSPDGAGYWATWKRRAETNAKAAAIVERYHHRPAEELYDLSADPFEEHNLAADPSHVETLVELRGEVDGWMVQNGDQGLASEEAAKPKQRQAVQ